MNDDTTVEQWVRLGDAGLTVSVCYGRGMWSVQVLNQDGEDFKVPYAARDFSHAIQVATVECRERGWLTKEM